MPRPAESSRRWSSFPTLQTPMDWPFTTERSLAATLASIRVGPTSIVPLTAGSSGSIWFESGEGENLMRIRIHALLLLPLLTGTATFGQTGAATLVGAVTDSTGAVVPGAKVSVVNSGTAFLSETTTSADGSYYVPYLSPGAYRITLEASGFKRYVHDGVIVRAGETPRVDVTLEIGSVTEAVEVSAQSPLLATESTVVGQIMDSEAVAKVQSPQGHIVRLLS